MTEEITIVTPLQKNCRIKVNLNTIMQCHQIAIHLFDNSQSTDLLLDKYNEGKGQDMMETCAAILREAVDPDYHFRVLENRKKWNT